jgi:hypothetical protein
MKKERSMKTMAWVLVASLAWGTAVQAAPRAALFVQNRAGAALEGQLDAFNDLLSTRLTDAGFEVIRSQDVLDRFAESRGAEAAQELRQAVEALQTVKSEGTVDGPSREASALRTAQLMDADLLVMASLVSLGENTVRSQSYGVPQEATITTLRLALRVLEGQGGTQLYGDTVAVNEKRMQTAVVQTDAGDLLNTLLDRGAVELAGRVGSSHEKFAAAAEPVWATVTVNTPAAGAAVEIDGVVAGTAPGTIRVRPGVHEIRVTREGYATWEKSVALADGQVLEVPLELSAVGLARKGEREAQERVDDIAREQSEADAFATKTVAGGVGQSASNTYIRLEGMPNESLTIGGEGGTDANLINVIQQDGH